MVKELDCNVSLEDFELFEMDYMWSQEWDSFVEDDDLILMAAEHFAVAEHTQFDKEPNLQYNVKGEVRVHNNLHSNERSYIAYLAHKVSCLQIKCMMHQHSVKKLLKRSISIQTLAPRKKKTKKSSTPLNPNVNCPVGTPSTLVETKQHKPSTARALYHNGSVASPAPALTVMTETDTTTPQYDSKDVGSSNGYEDTSDSELTSYIIRVQNQKARLMSLMRKN